MQWNVANRRAATALLGLGAALGAVLAVACDGRAAAPNPIKSPEAPLASASSAAPIASASSSALASAAPQPPNAYAADLAPLLTHMDARVDAWIDHPQRVGNNFACAMTCHTAAPMALLRGATATTSTTLDRLEKEVVARVASAPNWKRASPMYGAAGSTKARESRATEAVLNALTLAEVDRARGRPPTDATNAAFRAMWQVQRDDGGFDWLDFSLEPFEHGESGIGAALAAVAVGALPLDSRVTYVSQIDSLGTFLVAASQAPDAPLFDQAIVVFGLASMGRVYSVSRQVLTSLSYAENQDGGYPFVRLGIAGDRGALYDSDALPTAIAALAFQAMGECDRARSPISWLLAHREAGGTFVSASPNKDRPLSNLVMSDAANGFAGLVLQSSCGR